MTDLESAAAADGPERHKLWISRLRREKLLVNASTQDDDNNTPTSSASPLSPSSLLLIASTLLLKQRHSDTPPYHNVGPADPSPSNTKSRRAKPRPVLRCRIVVIMGAHINVGGRTQGNCLHDCGCNRGCNRGWSVLLQLGLSGSSHRGRGWC